MSQHRMDSHEYNLRDCAGESGRGDQVTSAGPFVAGLLLLAAHLAAFAAALAVARDCLREHDAQAVATMLGCVLAGLLTWGAMRIGRSAAVAAAIILAGCWGLAAVLTGPAGSNLMTLWTVAAIAAAADRRRAPAINKCPERFSARPQFTLRAALGLMTLVAVAAAASRVSWLELVAEWSQPLTPMVTGVIVGLAVAGARLVVASASQASSATRRGLAIIAALVVIGSAGWLYRALGLGPAWCIAIAAALIVFSLWASAAVCRPARVRIAATVASATSA